MNLPSSARTVHSRLDGRSGAALLLATLLLAACSGDRDDAERARTTAPRLTPVSLGEAEYTLLFEEGTRVRLHEGRYVRESDVQLTVTLHPRLARGDLDEDGTPDAAVVLLVDGGGSGTFYELAAVIDRDGVATHAASLALGDRIDLVSIEIVDGDILVRYRGHGPEDPLCCPTQDMLRAFALGEEGLVDVTRPDEGKLPSL